MIELKNVCKEYQTKAEKVDALKNINLTLPEKGFVFLIGNSGCGKSTLLNVVSGLDRITSGEMLVDGKEFSKFSSKQLDDYRNVSVGFVFQEYNLIDEYTVYENIAISLSLRGEQHLQEKVANALQEVGLAGYEKRKTNELSGGQKQRVAIARAIIADVNVLFADEPTGNLDSTTSKEIFELLQKLSKKHLVFAVTHDEKSARTYGDRIIKMFDGKIVSDEILSKEDEKNKQILKAEEVQNLAKTDVKCKNKGINLQSLTKLSFINVWKKKWRLLVTVVLFFFMLTLFGVSVSALRYNEVRVSLDTWYKYGVNDIRVTKTTEPGDGKIFSPAFTQQEKEELQKKFPNHKFNFVYSSSADIFGNTYLTSGVVEITDSLLDQYGYSMAWGNLPTKYNEVCLTKYLADQIIKDKVYSNIKNYEDFGKKEFRSSYAYRDIGFKVVGIVDTKTQNYEKYFNSLDEGMQSTIINGELRGSYTFANFVCKEFFDKVYYNDNAVWGKYAYYKYSSHLSKPEYVLEEQVDIFQQSYIDVLKQMESTSIDGSKPIDKVVLKQGKTQLEKGEIIIPYGLIVNKVQDVIGHSISGVKDEQIMQYMNGDDAWLNNVLCYSAYGEELSKQAYKIVGYYTGTSRALFLSDKDRVLLKDDGGPVWISTNLTGGKEDVKLVEEFFKPEYTFNGYYDEVMSAHSLAKTYRQMGLYATLAFGVFSVIMMANFIISSINSNKKQIGILRALGMRTTGVIYIFLLESLIAGIVAFLLACITIYPVALFLSQLYVSYGMFVQVLQVTVVEILAMLGLSILVCIIASIIPILKKAKKQPVQLIRE